MLTPKGWIGYGSGVYSVEVPPKPGPTSVAIPATKAVKKSHRPDGWKRNKARKRK